VIAHVRLAKEEQAKLRLQTEALQEYEQQFILLEHDLVEFDEVTARKLRALDEKFPAEGINCWLTKNVNWMRTIQDGRVPPNSDNIIMHLSSSSYSDVNYLVGLLKRHNFNEL
jgi:hypothetical protein